MNHMSFEQGIPENVSVSKGKLSVSTKHRTDGQFSLRWDFVPKDILTIRGEIGYQPHEIERVIELLGEKYPQMGSPTCFNFPVYSEANQDVRVRFAFGRGDTIDCYTDVLLDFKHWYEFSMGYDRGHLKGTPREDMDCFQIIIKSDKSGTVFLDDLVFSVKKSVTGLTPSRLELFQKTYPNRTIMNGADVQPDFHLNEPWFPLKNRVSESEAQAFKTIEDRLFDLEWGGRTKIVRLDENRLQSIRDKYNGYHICRDKNGIVGDYRFNKGSYNRLLREIGLLYYKVSDADQKDELGTMAVNMIEHMIDINGGMTWYSGKGFADACFLVKDKLKESGLLEATISALKDKLFFRIMYDEDTYKGLHAGKGINTDDLFTNSISTIICVLLMDDTPEKVRDMRHLVSFYSNSAFEYTPGPSDSFKPDGTMFHHVNAYPDRYGYYTMPVVCEFIYLLSRTDFHLSAETHGRMKENVRSRCFYKSQHYFPWAFAHNMVRPVQKVEADEVLYLALAGTPDGKYAIDEEMASLYLLNMEGETLPASAQQFIDAGIASAPVPQGHKTLSYYAKGLHRKNDWFITVGAFSKYVYPCEMWQGRSDGRGDVKTNKFVNWGQTEIIYPDKAGLKYINNGWDLDGWDWTRFPGTTTLKVPLSRIPTTVTAGVEHLRSDQGFVGGLDFNNGNGLFVAKIRGHHKYKFDSFYATKTYFFFGDLMICLGSDITNDLPEYMTQTTLMQNALKDQAFELYINHTQPVKDDFFTKAIKNKSLWMLDSRNVGYYLPKGQSLHVSYANQKSRDDHDTKDTEGVFETAWLEHGKAPENAGYEYAVKVKTRVNEMEDFAIKMNSEDNKEYRVIRADRIG
ncbi:chondroitinase family polysaccharide lyase, partial [Planctomycetota bacterium]